MMQFERLCLPTILIAVAATGGLVAGCGSSSTNTASSAGSGSAANAADRAFVQQMIPHHMMAVQMAQTAPQHAAHPQIKTLAASIIGDQQAEIAQMTPIAKQLGVKPDAMPAGGGMAMGSSTTGSNSMGSSTIGSSMRSGDHMTADAQALGMSTNEMGMSMDMSTLSAAMPFDRAFVDMMIPHHQGAIRMARAELAKGRNATLRSLAGRIVSAQDREITEMNQWRQKWYGATSPAGGVPAA